MQHARLRRAAARARGLRQRHLKPQHQAGAWRRALSRAGQHLAGHGSAEGARPAAAERAAHLVHDLPFVVPNYSWWEAPFYGIGMKVYDLLAGKYGFGRSKVLSLRRNARSAPDHPADGLRGGVLYHDGQFDDTRLLTHLLATAADHGATVVNYAEVVSTLKGADGFVTAWWRRSRDPPDISRSPREVVVNATGIFTDATRRLAQPDVKPMVAPSQGIHLVSIAPSCAATPPSWSRIPAMAAYCSPSPGTTTLWWGPPIPDRRALLRTPAFEAGDRVRARNRAAVFDPAAIAQDVLQCVRGHPPAGEGAPARRGQDLRPVPRSHHPYRRLRAADDRRRQVDHLSAHGGGLRRTTPSL